MLSKVLLSLLILKIAMVVVVATIVHVEVIMAPTPEARNLVNISPPKALLEINARKEEDPAVAEID